MVLIVEKDITRRFMCPPLLQRRSRLHLTCLTMPLLLEAFPWMHTLLCTIQATLLLDMHTCCRTPQVHTMRTMPLQLLLPQLLLQQLFTVSTWLDILLVPWPLLACLWLPLSRLRPLHHSSQQGQRAPHGLPWLVGPPHFPLQH